MSELSEWLDNEVYPRIFENADKIFIEHQFSRRGKYWISPTYLNGQPHKRKDKTYISEEAPYCISEQGGDSVNFYKYIQDRDGLNDAETIQRLGELVELKPPSNRSEDDYLRYKTESKRATILESLNSYFVYSLNNEKGGDKDRDQVKTYLRERGYSEEDVKGMGFGYVPNVDRRRKYLLKKGFTEEEIKDSVSLLPQMGTSHKLSIPYRNGAGKVIGFVVRSIGDEVKPKYLYTKGLQRGATFFNIGSSKRSETLIIVEGILDALLLTQRGIKGVVACGGDSPTEDQIKNALDQNKKLKRVILSLDTDEAGQKGTLRGIKILRDKDLTLYVAKTTSYKDADELVRAEGIEKYREVLNNAESWVKWSCNYILNEGDISTDIGQDKLLSQLLELEDSLRDPLESEYIIKFIAETLGYSEETISDKVLSYHEKERKDQQQKKLQETLRRADKTLRGGDFVEATNIVEEGLVKARSIVASNIVRPYSTELAIAEIMNKQAGLVTGYSSLDRYITIPTGALTLIAGRPSHGKTTFLLNLILKMVEKYKDKRFYFFSYEESKSALFIKLITILSDVIINKNYENKNSQQIEFYIRGGANKPRDKKTPMYKINENIQKYDKYVQDGRIWIVDTPLDVDTLAGTAEDLTYRGDLGAIFIDYAQRVKFNGRYETERVKIARISETLRETATRLDIPLIVGTQLNRDNKGKPQLDHLKEAGNLEEDANLVLGLYNWRTAIDKEKADGIEKNGEKSKKLYNCTGGEIVIDTRKIDFEVHILKNRNGVINESALLKFDAPTLNIKERFTDTVGKDKNREEIPF
jgi:DNA primase catalytic core